MPAPFRSAQADRDRSTTALIKTEDEVCVLRVASNDNAEIEVGAMHRLMDRFAENQPGGRSGQPAQHDRRWRSSSV